MLHIKMLISLNSPLMSNSPSVFYQFFIEQIIKKKLTGLKFMEMLLKYLACASVFAQFPAYVRRQNYYYLFLFIYSQILTFLFHFSQIPSY